MPKQAQSATKATAAKTQPKPAPAPAQELAAAPAEAGLLDVTGTASFQGNTQRLGNSNLPRIQRQMMAGRIGRMQGNGHLQQVMGVATGQLQQPLPSQSKSMQPIQAAIERRGATTADKQAAAPRRLDLMPPEPEQPISVAANAAASSISPMGTISEMQQSNGSAHNDKLIQRGVGDFFSNAWEGAKSLGSRALSGLQRLGSGMVSRLRRLGSGVLERLEQMGEAALEWGPRILSFMTNPAGALAGGMWQVMPDDLKPPLINTILRFAGSILGRLRGIWSAAIGPLWPLASSFMMGFIRRMAQVANSEKIRLSNKLADIISGGSLNFIIGLAKGLALGLWDVVKMPYDLIVGIVGGVQFIANVLSNLGIGALRAGAQLIANSMTAAWDGLRQMALDPRRAVQFIQTIWHSISRAVGQMGRGLAQALLNFINLPDDQMGEQVGRFASEFAVDGLLAIFTAGAGTLLRRAASIAGRFVRWFRRGGRALGRMMRMIRSAVDPLIEGVGRVGQVFRNSRFGAWLGNFRAWLNRVMDSVGDLASRATRRGRGRTPDVGSGRSGRRALGETAEEAGDASRRGRRAADDVTENAQEYAEAKAITAANERMGTPVRALINLLSRRFPARRFRAVPLAPGHSRVVMRVTVDGDYDPEDLSQLSIREEWVPPAGSKPKPPSSASHEERLEWLRERLNAHRDQAIERFEVEGLTPRQAADAPRYATHRGSRIDQFVKDSIMQDPDLAELITAPDFYSEPDILDSVLPDWFDVTTKNSWKKHLEHYRDRYGPAGHLIETVKNAQ